MRILLLILLSITLCMALPACGGTISQRIPAVVGNDGGLVNVTVGLVQAGAGAGQIYAGVYPNLGVSTQESIDQAIQYAFNASGRDMDCDVLVSFDSSKGPTSYIEGPSAGAALTVMTYALLHGKAMRNDTIITGTIEDLGVVGPVGGLYEKSTTAARGGARYFITPSEGIYEMLILRNVERRTGIGIIQADKVSDIIGFMLENKTIDQQGIAPEKRPVPDMTPYDRSGMVAFSAVAGRMVGLENSTLAAVSGKDNDSASVRDFFGNEVARQKALLDNGYLFSAANEAFLNYIDLSTIKAILAGDSDLARKKGEVGICLTSIKRPALTSANYEWVVGADLRQAWAYDKLGSAKEDPEALEDERYLKINDLSYGQAWCEVAKSLISAAPGGGEAMDESVWRSLAEQKMDEAKAKSPQKQDSISRLDIAQKSFNDGRYGAAIFDAAYVINNEEAPPAKDKLKAGTDALLSQKPSSLWGRIYQSHAAFLLSQNLTDAAYSTARFAKELDGAAGQMNLKGIDAQPAKEQPQRPPASSYPSGDQMLLIALGIGVSIFLLLVAVIVSLSRRANGSYSERAGRANRAKQKKG
jgi:predicted S18 family serine protease